MFAYRVRHIRPFFSAIFSRLNPLAVKFSKTSEVEVFFCEEPWRGKRWGNQCSDVASLGSEFVKTNTDLYLGKCLSGPTHGFSLFLLTTIGSHAKNLSLREAAPKDSTTSGRAAIGRLPPLPSFSFELAMTEPFLAFQLCRTRGDENPACIVGGFNSTLFSRGLFDVRISLPLRSRELRHKMILEKRSV